MPAFDDVALCIVAHNSPKEFKLFTWMLDKATTYPCKYYILDNGSDSESTIQECQNLWTNNKGIYDRVQSPIRVSECYNRLLNAVEQEYCVFVPINNILSDGWVQEILHRIKSIDMAGAVSIKSQNDNLIISGCLSDEKIKLCYRQKDNNVKGMLFGKTELLKDIGGFDTESDIDGFEFEEISHRLMLSGRQNFYCHSAKRIEMPIENEILFPKTTEERLSNYRKKLQINFKTTQDGKHESATN